MILLSNDIIFPPVHLANEDGLLAIGGDLSAERLLLAYKTGIFPWFNNNEPILWWSPNPRFVLFPEKLKVSKSMKQLLHSSKFQVTVNQDFKAVITACSAIKRKDEYGTWITQSMIDAYINLHKLGYATSVEVWSNNELVGGFYGIDTGNGVFCGESMFSKVSNSSKVGFITFIQQSSYKLIDCQIHSNHLESLGAEFISREMFTEFLN